MCEILIDSYTYKLLLFEVVTMPEHGGVAKYWKPPRPVRVCLKTLSLI